MCNKISLWSITVYMLSQTFMTYCRAIMNSNACTNFVCVFLTNCQISVITLERTTGCMESITIKFLFDWYIDQKRQREPVKVWQWQHKGPRLGKTQQASQRALYSHHCGLLETQWLFQSFLVHWFWVKVNTKDVSVSGVWRWTQITSAEGFWTVPP